MDEIERDEKHDEQDQADDKHDSETPSSAAEKLPGAPAPDDDSPLGDTDQHAD